LARAIRAGWLDSPELADRRKALVEALDALLDDPTLTDRETLRLGRIIAVMNGALTNMKALLTD